MGQHILILGTDLAGAAGLVFDAKGDLEGTTAEGGNGCDTLFKLTPASGGK